MNAHQDCGPIVSTLLEDEPELDDLVEQFIIKLPQLIEEAESLYAASSWSDFHRKVHDLKGVGGNFGFEMISEVAKRIEQAVKTDDCEAIPSLFQELEGLRERIQLGRVCA